MEPVLAWLYTKHPSLAGVIDLDDDLIESRLVDSLHFLEFVYVVEEASGCAIDMRAHSVENFRTLRRIERRFFSATDPTRATSC